MYVFITDFNLEWGYMFPVRDILPETLANASELSSKYALAVNVGT